MRNLEVMAVGPWFPHAARMLRDNAGLDVGPRLALTSESAVARRGFRLIGYRQLEAQ